MKVGQMVEAAGCKLIDILWDGDPDNPRYEVEAKDGYHFKGGLHVLVCFDLNDVRERVRQLLPLELCAEDCDCKE